MSQTLNTVLQSAMALPNEDRARLAEALWASLESAPPALLGEEWQAEVQRRSAEYRAGLVEPIPWSQVRADGRAKSG